MSEKCLIISTLQKTDKRMEAYLNKMMEDKEKEILYTENYRIRGCLGCTGCWLKTPGVCTIKDDYIEIFQKMLKADRIIFVTEAKLGFISYQCKDLIDRIIPLALPYTVISRGAMRHKPRYQKKWKIGLIYTGDGDKLFLEQWLKRVALNFFSESLGSYDIMKEEDLCYGIGNI